MKKLLSTVRRHINKLLKAKRGNRPIHSYEEERFTEKELETLSKRMDTPIKRYTKSELALLYRRQSQTLMRWINSHELLMNELKRKGYKKSSKEFTKEQVLLVFVYLGEP